jgi:uncharacterized integral membrane protein (TIGR00698 family)
MNQVARGAAIGSAPSPLRRSLDVWPLVLLAVASVALVPRTPLRVLGPLTVALLAGMALRPLPFVRAIPRDAVGWLSREVLRAGVVLVGVRLDWVLLARAGAGPLVIAATAVVVGLVLFGVLLRVLGVPRRLGALLAIGSSVCGAAAITAARPVVGAADEEANVGIAIVSVLGALASVGLVLAHGAGWLSEPTYGLVAGGALHEVAHVMAAATAAPAAVGVATVTKLARVALLPVALIATPWIAGRETRGERARFRVPPLVLWFLVASVVSTLLGHALPPSAADSWALMTRAVSQLATILLASSMVGIGALVDWASLRRAGMRPLIMAVVGALLLGSVVVGVAMRV